jgi:hypothetical protein
MLNVRDDVRLAPLLAAALLKGLFEHPSRHFAPLMGVRAFTISGGQKPSLNKAL